MARTKNKARKNTDAKPAQKQKTRSQARMGNEQSAPTQHQEPMEGVIVISSDPEPERVGGPSTKRQKQEKRTDSIPKQDGDSVRDSPLISALELAFSQKRALMISIDPGHHGSATERAAKEAARDETYRDKLYKAITESPLTSSAWISQSLRIALRSWFVLCIFSVGNEAQIAYDLLDGKLSLTERPHVTVRCSLYPFKAQWNIAKMIDPAKALPPRGPQSIPEPDLNVESAKAPRAPSSAAPRNERTKASVAQTKQPREIPASRIISQAENLNTTANSQIPTGPKQLQQSSAENQAPRPLPLKQQQVIEPPASTSSIPRRDSAIIDAMSLLEMEYSEQVKFQCRYIGEVEEGVPIFGCILCGRRDHLWDDCAERTCEHCGEKDKHGSRACPKVKKCSKCLEKGHTTEQCTSKLRRTAEDGFHCDRCGDDTHLEDDCSYIWRNFIPEKEPNVKKAPKLSVYCYNCGEEGHWGADCFKPRETPKSHYDIFSAKEAGKYIDPSAPLSNLLSDVAEIQIRGQANGAGLTIRGAGASHQASTSSGRAGYSQHPVQQSRKQSVSYTANNSSSWQAVNRAEVSMQPSHVQQQTQYYHQSNAYQQTYSNTHIMTLPARPTNRGNDGYVRYQGSQPQGSWSNPAPRQHSRSRSPPNRRDDNYRHRNDDYGGSGLALPNGWYDDRGAFHYDRPGRQYDSRPPPPPPDADYGRRQTYRAVPPPPPEPSRSHRRGGGY